MKMLKYVNKHKMHFMFTPNLYNISIINIEINLIQKVMSTGTKMFKHWSARSPIVSRQWYMQYVFFNIFHLHYWQPIIKNYPVLKNHIFT